MLHAYDVNHILGTGQSLSVGAVGSPPLSLTQPFANVKLAGGIFDDGGARAYVPLVEGDFYPGTTTAVETMSSALANLVTQLAGGSHVVLASQHGIGGQPYSAIKKGGSLAAYATGMGQLDAGASIAQGLGKSYVVRAVTCVHGESDHDLRNTEYQTELIAWQADYEADVRARTGQSEAVPMFHTQISSWQRLDGATTSIIPGQQLGAHVAAPGKVVLVGAKYHLPYAADGVHLTNAGYQHMGEDYAKAYRRVILEGKTWEPLRPKSVTRSGNVITVTFFVPSPPLVLDTTLVSDPGNKGFEYADDASSATITSVALAGPDSVAITLSAAPTGANPHVRYAWTATPNALSGVTTGPRGNLRDSDATPSLHGFALYNWCVHFDEPVP